MVAGQLRMDGKHYLFLKIWVAYHGLRVPHREFAVHGNMHHDVSDPTAGEWPFPHVGAQIVIGLLSLHSEDNIGADAELSCNRPCYIDIDTRRTAVLVPRKRLIIEVGDDAQGLCSLHLVERARQAWNRRK